MDKTNQIKDFLKEYRALCETHGVYFIGLNGGELDLWDVGDKVWDEGSMEFWLPKDYDERELIGE
jgi:hypothetical protein